MRREDAWRLRYRRERYMRDLPDEDLFARAGALLTSMLVFNGEGKIGPELSDGGIEKMERFTHVLEELSLRGLHLKHPGVLEALNVPKPARVRRAIEAMAGHSWPEPILVKFGKPEHMTALFREGKGRISRRASTRTQASDVPVPMTKRA